MATLPSKSDINIHNSLDEQSAVEYFLDKNLIEAECLFRDNFLYYYGYLMWMGPIAFNYYVQAAVNYLLGPDSVGDFRRR